MGGLLGAMYGYGRLEMEEQINKIGNWVSSNKKRPDWLNPGKVIPKYVDFMMVSAPCELKMVGCEAEYPEKVKKWRSVWSKKQVNWAQLLFFANNMQFYSFSWFFFIFKGF